MRIVGEGVPTVSPNPNPISDQKVSFFTPVFRPGIGKKNYLDYNPAKRFLEIHFEFPTLSYSFGIEMTTDIYTLP